MILTFDSIRASARTNAKCSYIYADCFAVISKFQNYGTSMQNEEPNDRSIG